MAYIAASRVAFACLAMICFVVGGGGAEEKNRSLLNFAVDLPYGSGRVEFVCELGSGYVEAGDSVHIDSSELNLLERIVLSDHHTKGFGEFVCWREKLDISLTSEIFEDLGSQIQGFFSTYRLRSLLASDGESNLAPTAQINGTQKISEDNSSAVYPLKEDPGETPNDENSPGSETKKPEDVLGTPPPKDNELIPPPPSPKGETKKEEEKKKETPVIPVNQQHDSDDCKYNDQVKNLYTRLETSGDGKQIWTLSLRNEGEGVLEVQVKTPKGLLADPSGVHLRKGESASKVNISVVDEALLAKEGNLSILISSGEGECTVPVIPNVFGNLESQSYFDRISMPNMPVVITTEMRLGAFFFILSIIGGLVIWRTWARWRHRDVAGAGHSYQELEMSLPSNVDNSTSAYGQEKDEKSGSGDEDGWDEVWDDWEDTEAARSSSRLIPNLSAKGLAARRSNKDGWESSWDD